MEELNIEFIAKKLVFKPKKIKTRWVVDTDSLIEVDPAITEEMDLELEELLKKEVGKE
jgi:hypothetical protein